MKPEAITIIRAALLLPGSGLGFRIIPRGELVFDQQGTIVYCGPARGGRALANIYRAPQGSILIPGLIDVHTHLSQYHVRGRTGHTLMHWLSHYVFPAEARLSRPEYARRLADRFFEKLLSNGVSLAAIYTNFRCGAEQAMESAARKGIRAVIGLTLMDRNVPGSLRQRPEQTLEDCRALFEKARRLGSERIMFSVNPRFAPACSPKLMEMIGKFAQDTGCYIQTHLSENRAEIDMVQRLFPGAEYAQVYDRYRLLGPRTLLAHCIHLSASERDLLKKRGCAVVHCPSSNLFLHSGRFPLEHWRDYPKLCLGTDVGAGPSFSMLDTMRDAYYLNPWRPEDLFRLATRGGARALGLEDSLGSLEPGRKADFSLVSLAEGCRGNVREWLSDLIFKWDQVRFLKVYIEGRAVWSSEP